MPLSPTQALATCTHVLQSVFGYAAFRGPQAEIVERVSQGADALVLMPTGGGKSLCYQVPAIARHQAGLGVSIVVSPLIALMHDQVGALQEAGVAAAYLNSSLDFERAQAVERDLMAGRLTLLYVAPERLTTPRFMALLDRLHAQHLLSLIAIDEAHCVSQWGHDFRPEYRALHMLGERFSGVPRLALTATADAITREDMVTQLALEGARRFVSSFDRPNIRYTIVEKRDATAQLLRFIRDEHSDDTGHDSGIVYCQSRRRVEEVAEQLCREGLTALPYHAGLDAAVRRENQDRFLREEQVIVVATIAFGMGIDKPNVRFVAHLDMPKNMEGYYQETGRCGRDGEAGNAWMVYGLQDVVNQRRMIDDSPAGEDFKQVMRGKLDALLALAESAECRRVRILGYFGEDSQPCGNCDNCLHPPAQFDATEAARKLLSCIYRVQQSSGMAFGAGHLMDILRGKLTEKVAQYQHDQLSTFGIGSDWSETQWRALLRQLIAREAISVDAAHFNTLRLDAQAKPLLKGEVQVWMKEASTAKRSSQKREAKREADHAELTTPHARAVYDALKAWRGEVAREHGLPAYVIFHDATLRALAQNPPRSAADLHDVSGMGEKKREAYGHEVLRVVRDAAAAVS